MGEVPMYSLMQLVAIAHTNLESWAYGNVKPENSRQSFVDVRGQRLLLSWRCPLSSKKNKGPKTSAGSTHQVERSLFTQQPTDTWIIYRTLQ